MLICFDVGNTHILGGIYEGDKLVLRFRHSTHPLVTADQFGIFLHSFMTAQGTDPKQVTAAALCSVVPGVNFMLRRAVQQYFNTDVYQLHGGAKTGLNILYKNPAEVGPDRLADAIAAVHAYPGKNIIVVDMGTATTVGAITKTKDFLGGVIMPGVRVAMESLKSNTARLMEVDLEAQATYLGQVTRDSIQKGIYFGQVGALKEIIGGLTQERFGDDKPVIVGTGGFSQIFRDAGIFDVILPDLVLDGIRLAWGMSGK